MQARVLMTALAIAALVAAAPMRAQQGAAGGQPGSGRAQAAQAMHERRQARAERVRNTTPEQRTAARERMQARVDSRAPAQREALKTRRAEGRRPVDPAYAQALREERKGLRDRVKAGALDRHAAAEQLREWMKTHRPAAPRGDGE